MKKKLKKKTKSGHRRKSGKTQRNEKIRPEILQSEAVRNKNYYKTRKTEQALEQISNVKAPPKK